MRQILSVVLFRPRDAFGQAPVLEQSPAAERISLFEGSARGDPVGAKVAKRPSEFAPGQNHARLVEIADAERPDRAFSADALCVVVLERKFAFGPDGGANRSQVQPGVA